MTLVTFVLLVPSLNDALSVCVCGMLSHLDASQILYRNWDTSKNVPVIVARPPCMSHAYCCADTDQYNNDDDSAHNTHRCCYYDYQWHNSRDS